MSQKPLFDARLLQQRAAAMREAGMTVASIGEALGCCHWRVCQVLNSHQSQVTAKLPSGPDQKGLRDG